MSKINPVVMVTKRMIFMSAERRRNMATLIITSSHEMRKYCGKIRT